MWGYFQARSEAAAVPLPPIPLAEFAAATTEPKNRPEVQGSDDDPGEEVDLLGLVDPTRDSVSGTWSKTADGRLESPKGYGTRIELPYVPPDEYRLTVVAEPLDEPNGLILGGRSGGNRFLTLLNYGEGPASALENVDGRNVGNNDTTHQGKLFEKGRTSFVTIDVRRDGVRVAVDGRRIIDWEGDASRLSLSEYWETPNREALFIGAYDCRYRFHRIGVTPISGKGRPVFDAGKSPP